MLEPEIGLVFGSKLKFDQSFLQFNVKNKNICKVLLSKNILNLTRNGEY